MPFLIVPHIFKHFVCLGILPACMCTPCVCLVLTGARKRELDLGCPGIGVMGSCEPSCGCWGLNVGLLEEHQKFLATKQFLQPSHHRF